MRRASSPRPRRGRTRSPSTATRRSRKKAADAGLTLTTGSLLPPSPSAVIAGPANSPSTETDTAAPGYSCFYDFAVLTAAMGSGSRQDTSSAYSTQDGQPSNSQSSGGVDTFTATNSSGVRRAISCRFIESRATTYLRGDCLKVRCDVTVYKELRTEDHDVPARLVAVPPSDMGEQLGRLRSSGVGADLRFEVAGETFAAHRDILAVRSPVLLEEIVSGCLTKATEAATCGIQISGVEARVFMALFHYIYTDSLPEIDEDETTDMARHLIAVTNRYGLDRVKLICEDLFCRRVDTSRVAATLAVAEQYNCYGLKKACFRFLMSGSNLKAAMAAGGFEHLRTSRPAVLKELLAMVVR